MRRALLFSDSPAEAHALLGWLKERTLNAVSTPWFRRIQNEVVPVLVERRVLSEVEVLDIVRPIAAEVLDLTPKTRRGRLRLRWRRILFRVRRTIRKPHPREKPQGEVTTMGMTPTERSADLDRMGREDYALQQFLHGAIDRAEFEFRMDGIQLEGIEGEVWR